MKVGILGLGLIGGSLARAYALHGHTVYAKNRSDSILSFAMLSGAVHGKLDAETPVFGVFPVSFGFSKFSINDLQCFFDSLFGVEVAVIE